VARAEYDRDYFESQARGTKRSAEVIVPVVMELLSPRSVCDVGCGQGIWLGVFEQHGVRDVLGIDGDYVDRESLQIDPEKFVFADLQQGVPDVGSFDLAVSLEVAEHLPESAAQNFVAGLVGLAPAVLFSAAVPGQGGLGHVNEQWPPYWRQLFLEHDYRLVDCVRPRIWNSSDVKEWYRQNTLLFAAPSVLQAVPALLKEKEHAAGRPLSIVHPELLRMMLLRLLLSWRELSAGVEAGRLTQEEMHRRMAAILEELAGEENR
jgi:SAM-dependent methyltransferase